jgi:hypothetical protein
MMEMNKEIATYDLAQYQVHYGNGHELLVTNPAGQEQDMYSLSLEPLFLQVEGENGSRQLKIGTGRAVGETFFRAYCPNGADSFRVLDSQGIGVGDLRDGLRIVLQYDLSQVCIALDWDGVYLQIQCPGNPEGGALPWFSETSGN